MTDQPPPYSADNPPPYTATPNTPGQNVGQGPQGGNLSEGFQDQYPQEGDLSQGLQFDSPGAGQGTNQYPGQTWLPPGHVYPTLPSKGNESTDTAGSYPGQSWLPPGHQYPAPQPGPTLVTHTVVVQDAGNCPKCRLGWVEDRFTPLGIILGVLFFPLGIICCLMLREYRCSYCGAEFTDDELRHIGQIPKSPI